MNLVKCPRCELNYLLENEELCKVCLREMKGEEKNDDIEFCSMCNAAPALFGKDVCLSCQREMLSSRGKGDAEEGISIGEDTMTLNSVSTMDEIIPQIHVDIPEGEFGEIENELSIKGSMEDEQNDDPGIQSSEE